MIDFDNVEDMPCGVRGQVGEDGEVWLGEGFRGTRKLTIFVEDNVGGGMVTEIGSVRLYGKVGF